MHETMLLKYFSGNASSEEQEAIENWIDVSEDNKDLAEKIYHIYYSTEALRCMQTVDTAAALQKVNIRINKYIRKVWYNRAQRIAAILFIPFFCISLYFFSLNLRDSGEYMEVKTAPGMVSSVVLPDQSKVWLNSNSRLTYPVKFTKKERRVQLIGEGYFEVTPDRRNKFIVETSRGMDVEVLGTEFNIEAYAMDENITTTLVSGKVKVNYLSGEQQHFTSILSPGYQIVYNTKSRSAFSSQATVSVATAWREMKLVFRRTSLDEVLKLLTKRFDVEFIVLNEQLKAYTFTGTFDEQQLPHILEHIRQSSGIKYRILDFETAEEAREKTKIELY